MPLVEQVRQKREEEIEQEERIGIGMTIGKRRLGIQSIPMFGSVSPQYHVTSYAVEGDILRILASLFGKKEEIEINMRAISPFPLYYKIIPCIMAVLHALCACMFFLVLFFGLINNKLPSMEVSAFYMVLTLTFVLFAYLSYKKAIYSGCLTPNYIIRFSSLKEKREILSHGYILQGGSKSIEEFKNDCEKSSKQVEIVEL